MADITANMTQVYSDGLGDRTVLYRVKNVDTTDTVNVTLQFNKVKSATFLPTGTLTTVGTVSISGTVLTLTLTSLADDNIYLLVAGQSK